MQSAFVQFAIDHGLGRTRATVTDSDFDLYQKVHLLGKNSWLRGCLIQLLVRICGADTPRCCHGIREIIAGFPHTELTGWEIQSASVSGPSRHNCRMGHLIDICTVVSVFIAQSVGRYWKLHSSSERRSSTEFDSSNRFMKACTSWCNRSFEYFYGCRARAASMCGFLQNPSIEYKALRDHGPICDENHVCWSILSAPINTILTMHRVCIATGLQARYFQSFTSSADKTCKPRKSATALSICKLTITRGEHRLEHMGPVSKTPLLNSPRIKAHNHLGQWWISVLCAQPFLP